MAAVDAQGRAVAGPQADAAEMDGGFGLPARAVAVRDGVRAIARDHGVEYWSRCDAERRFPEELWAELARGGWLGLCIPEVHGGAGAGLLEMAVAVEELAAAGGGTGASFLFVLTPGFGALTIVRHGSPAQQEEILPGVARGEVEFCFALTEPDTGSDALRMRTTVRADGGDLVIRGQKTWISGVQRATWMLVAGREADDASGRGLTLALVDVAEAVRAGTLTYQPIDKMGQHYVQSNAVFLDDVRLPVHRVVGERGGAARVLWDVMNPERVLAAAGAVGHATLALRLAAAYARERIVFGRPIGSNQGIAFPLAQQWALTQLARLGTWRAAARFDAGLPAGPEANAAKLVACQAAWEATDRAFQTFGGMAYARENHVERLLRDGRIARVGPVSEEMILAHIAHHELGLPRSF